MFPSLCLQYENLLTDSDAFLVYGLLLCLPERMQSPYTSNGMTDIPPKACSRTFRSKENHCIVFLLNCLLNSSTCPII